MRNTSIIFKNCNISPTGVACLIVILALISVNIIAGHFDHSFDLTAERIYTLSDQTIEIIRNLDTDVTIYALFEEHVFYSNYYNIINELLIRYSRISPRISLQYRDLLTFPHMIERYRSEFRLPEAGGIIVESDDRFHIISPSDLIVTDHMFDGQTFVQIVTDVILEQQITNAILFVTGNTAPVIYHIVGHNESPLSRSLQERIESSNYVLRELNLLVTGEIPDDCSLLLITTPERDFAPLERDLIIEYIQNGGRIFTAVQGAFTDFPIFDEILDAIGIRFNNALLVERGTDNHYPGMSPLTIIPGYPDFSVNEIVQHMILRNALTLTPNATGITASDEYGFIRIEPLLVTSDFAYGITDITAQTIDYVPGYLLGPFSIAVAITDYETDFKAVIIGADSILDEVINTAIVGGNYEFILAAINWLQNRENNLFILPRNVPEIYVFMNQTTQAWLVFICLIVIPGIIFGAGACVVIKRNKVSEAQERN